METVQKIEENVLKVPVIAEKKIETVSEIHIPDNVSTASEDSIAPSLTIDRYFKGMDRIGEVHRIAKFLDGGNSGNVFAVQRFPEDDRFFVAKIFRSQSIAFDREVSALQQIGAHENIVSIIEVLKDVPYFSETDTTSNFLNNINCV
jgi:hypothetical protein